MSSQSDDDDGGERRLVIVESTDSVGGDERRGAFSKTSSRLSRDIKTPSKNIKATTVQLPTFHEFIDHQSWPKDPKSTLIRDETLSNTCSEAFTEDSGLLDLEPKKRRPTCSKCKGHYRTVSTKGHRGNCDYEHCPCPKCILIDEKRLVLREQVKNTRQSNESHELEDSYSENLEMSMTIGQGTSTTKAITSSEDREITQSADSCYKYEPLTPPALNMVQESTKGLDPVLVSILDGIPTKLRAGKANLDRKKKENAELNALESQVEQPSTSTPKAKVKTVPNKQLKRLIAAKPTGPPVKFPRLLSRGPPNIKFEDFVAAASRSSTCTTSSNNTNAVLNPVSVMNSSPFDTPPGQSLPHNLAATMASFQNQNYNQWHRFPMSNLPPANFDGLRMTQAHTFGHHPSFFNHELNPIANNHNINPVPQSQLDLDLEYRRRSLDASYQQLNAHSNYQTLNPVLNSIPNFLHGFPQQSANPVTTGYFMPHYGHGYGHHWPQEQFTNPVGGMFHHQVWNPAVHGVVPNYPHLEFHANYDYDSGRPSTDEEILPN